MHNENKMRGYDQKNEIYMIWCNTMKIKWEDIDKMKNEIYTSLPQYQMHNENKMRGYDQKNEIYDAK
jgi:hypothetical protein